MDSAAADLQLAAAELSAKDLLTNFESLGCNCEFGLVQRHFGAEKLGLLRWGAVQPEYEGLLHLLGSRLDGIAEDVSLETFGQEYISRETRYNIVFHTDREVGSITEERLLRSEKGRIRFMADSFLELLAGNDTIFVYKTHALLELPHLRMLLRQLRIVSAAPLLFVTLPRNPHVAGLVEDCGDGLYWGYIDAFSPPENVPSFCSYDMWLMLCRKTYDMWQASRPALAAPVIEVLDAIDEPPSAAPMPVAPRRQGFWRWLLKG